MRGAAVAAVAVLRWTLAALTVAALVLPTLVMVPLGILLVRVGWLRRESSRAAVQGPAHEGAAVGGGQAEGGAGAVGGEIDTAEPRGCALGVAAVDRIDWGE